MSVRDEGREPAGASRPPDLGGLIHQLGNTIERETAELRSGSRNAFDDIIARKQRSLLELTAALRQPTGHPGVGDASALEALREKLAANALALRANIAAAREIAALLCEIARDAESDGTYSARPTGRR